MIGIMGMSRGDCTKKFCKKKKPRGRGGIDDAYVDRMQILIDLGTGEDMDEWSFPLRWIDLVNVYK